MSKAFLKRWISALCSVILFIILLTFVVKKPIEVIVPKNEQLTFRWLDLENGTKVKKCRNSVQGKRLIADELGYVCDHVDLLPSGCCKRNGNSTERYSCGTCQQNRCCKVYEHCVSCCIQPNKRYILTKVLVRGQSSKTPLLRTVRDTFELCLAKCRTSSTSVLQENVYRDSVYKFCYGLDPPNLKGES